MKTLWTVVSFLAVVHLLALGLFAGWLWRSDRLDMQRMREVRELFAQTITEQAAAVDDPVEATGEADAGAMLTRLGSAEQLTMLTTLQEHEQQSARRIQDESDMLARQFEKLTLQTEADRSAFEAERAGWEQATRAERERKADEQFAQTVLQYESLPAKQGKNLLIELIGRGRQEQAVAYLDAMKSRAANKIIREFKSEEEVVLATELLEELRTFGLGTSDPKDDGNDEPDDNAEQPAP